MVPASDSADEAALAILDQVELKSLKATPGTIAPFAASLIEWNMSGPAGFSVLLENTSVPKIGDQLVTPLSTKTFRLKARAGRITQTLGEVTVTVDQTACRIVPVPNHFVQTKVQEGIDQLLLELSGTARRRPDVVTVDQSGIGIKLALKQEVDKFPNPDVDVEAHWVYRSSNGQLVADFDKLAVSVIFPWWVWLLPIAYPGLPIAISMAKDSTSAAVRRKAAEAADGLEFFLDPGFRILSAQFNPANFEMLACPDFSLRHLLFSGAPAIHATKS